MSESKAYSGGCQCGAVRYQVTLALDTVTACNCSICGKSGTLLAFAGEPEFTLLQGEDALTDYQFGKKRIHHLFCRTCGVRSFARGTKPDGTASYAINVRCLDEVDPDALAVRKHDGKSQ